MSVNTRLSKRTRSILGLVLAGLFTPLMVVLPTAPPAHAAVNTLTVVSTGGSDEGTGWSYAAGEISVSATVSINASDIIAKLNSGNLTIQADDLALSASITSATDNSLTLRATGNINVGAGISISTQGGDVIFQSDSDASGVGSIRLGLAGSSASGTVGTAGGDIIVSGGVNPLLGYAMASNVFEATKPAAGVAIYGTQLQAGGGNIIVRGSSLANDPNATRAVLLEPNAASTRATLETSSSGTITVTGDGSQIIGDNRNGWGVAMGGVTMRSASGAITVTGKANTGVANARGITASNSSFISTTGNISLDDTTDGTAANYTGFYVGGTLTDFSTLGGIAIRADEYISDGTLSFSGPSATLKPYTSQSFTAALPVGRLTATNCQNLVIGQSGNTSNVTFAFPVTVGGPATVYGSNITFGATFTSSANLFIYGSGNVTQSAAIATDGLALIGSGTFTLDNPGNTIRVLAAGAPGSRTGSVTVTDASGGLTIGQVSSLSGIYSSANVDISTVIGNLTLSQPVSSSAASGDSVKLYANKPAAAGTAGNGDIIVSGSGAVSVESGARALFYSGTRTASTGLLALVGGEPNTRSLVAASTSLGSITPSLGTTGLFALYRTADPALHAVAFDGNGATSGSMSAQTASTATALETNAFVRPEFTFDGWNTERDGSGTPYADGADFPFTSSETLYAQWTAVPGPTPTPNVLPTTGDSIEPLMLSGVSLLLAGLIAAAITVTRRRLASSREL